MGLTTFGVVSAGSLTDTWDPAAGSTNIAQSEPGTIQVMRRGAGQYSIVKVVQMHVTTRCSTGDVLMHSTASAGADIATVAITAQEGTFPKGVAGASIASGRRGYAVIGGIATVIVSGMATINQYLTINHASGFGTATLALTSSWQVVAKTNQAATNSASGASCQIHILGQI
jgi:hypothetical protein